MGDPRKRRKRYARPRKKFELARIKEEDSLLKQYGLKNKKELWKAEFKIEKIRRQAKNLINREGEQEKFLTKLRSQGFKVSAIDDVLALKKEDLLERRLQTLIVKKKFANTVRHARQLIVHKHICVDGKIINIPSFLVPLAFEDKIQIAQKPKKEQIRNVKEVTEKSSETNKQENEEKKDGGEKP